MLQGGATDGHGFSLIVLVSSRRKDVYPYEGMAKSAKEGLRQGQATDRRRFWRIAQFRSDGKHARLTRRGGSAKDGVRLFRGSAPPKYRMRRRPLSSSSSSSAVSLGLYPRSSVFIRGCPISAPSPPVIVLVVVLALILTCSVRSLSVFTRAT